MNTGKHGWPKHLPHSFIKWAFLCVLFAVVFITACISNSFDSRTQEATNLPPPAITATATPLSFVCLDCELGSALDYICPLASGKEEIREALSPYGEIQKGISGDHACLYVVAMSSPDWGYVYYVDETTATARFVLINAFLLTPSPTFDPNSPTPGVPWANITATSTPPFFGCVDCGIGSALEYICPLAGGDPSFREMLLPYGEIHSGSVGGHECLYATKFDTPTWGYLYYVEEKTEKIWFAVIDASLLTPTPITEFNRETLTPTPTSTPPWVGDLGWGNVTGIVSDANTGQPIAGARVTCQHFSYKTTTSSLCNDMAFTDDNGKYVFEEIFFHDTDRITIYVEAPGFDPVTFQQDFFTQPELHANISMSPAGVTPVICCTAPACNPGEVHYCPGDCPCGCGTTCVTITPVP